MSLAEDFIREQVAQSPSRYASRVRLQALIVPCHLTSSLLPLLWL